MEMEMEEVKFPISNLPPMAQIAGRPNRKGLSDFAPRCRALGRRLTTPDSMRGAVCVAEMEVGPSMHPCILAASNIQSSSPDEGSPQPRGGSGRLWVRLLPSGLSQVLSPVVASGVCRCLQLPRSSRSLPPVGSCLHQTKK
jgi:hypothetical protein